MNIECTNRNGRAIALVDGADEVVVKDAQTALDLLMAARYRGGADHSHR